MNDNDQLPVGCVIALLVVLIALGLFGLFAELARGWVWIKWAFH